MTAFPPFPVSIEHPKAITTRQECELIRSALARNPLSVPLQRRLATTLVVNDEYDEAIAVLNQLTTNEPSATDFTLLANALLSRETQAHNCSAADAARQAARLATNASIKAHALATLGKAQMRLGEVDSAHESLLHALHENPHDRNAYKRLVALHFEHQRPDAVLVLADSLQALGVAHSRLFASRTLAHAMLGNSAAASAADGFGALHRRFMLNPPAGEPDLATFNRGLERELLSHPALRFDRYGTASTQTWRIDEPGTGRPPYLAALQQRIVEQIEAFVSGLLDPGSGAGEHPWVRMRPDGGILHNWCVITDGPGFEEWHVHQNGWLSGVYYVAVPQRISDGDDEAGCLCFGLPETIVGEQAAAAFGRHWVRPQAGLLMLFPSHAYHRSFPHGVRERRICVAFDIWPVRANG